MMRVKHSQSFVSWTYPAHCTAWSVPLNNWITDCGGLKQCTA